MILNEKVGPPSDKLGLNGSGPLLLTSVYRTWISKVRVSLRIEVVFFKD